MLLTECHPKDYVIIRRSAGRNWLELENSEGKRGGCAGEYILRQNKSDYPMSWKNPRN